MRLDTREIETKAEAVVAPVILNMGYDLVACDFLQESGKWILRIYIDKKGGVTIDDCARASHGVEDLIAVEDVVPVRYLLEVSSPGIDRPLRKRGDFERSIGEMISLKTARPIDGRRNFKGVLSEFKGDEIVMIIDNQEYRVPFDEVRKAHLAPVDINVKKKVH